MDALNKKIPLVEMFGPTVQGEGTVLGQQTYFYRFGLCDYKCTMCDSLHAVLPAHVKANAEWLTQDELFDKFMKFRHPNSTDWVTFSGGNPAIHDLSYLVTKLHDSGIKINLETQGTKFLPWLREVDSLTISPKGPGMGETHNHEVFEDFMGALFNSAHLPNLCFKIVAFDQRDLEFAAAIFSQVTGYIDGLGIDTSNIFYLSLGNPNPPDPSGQSEKTFDIEGQLKQYKVLYEDICKHPVLSRVRFTPQWHAFVWGNDAGH